MKVQYAVYIILLSNVEPFLLLALIRYIFYLYATDNNNDRFVQWGNTNQAFVFIIKKVFHDDIITFGVAKTEGNAIWKLRYELWSRSLLSWG